MNVPEDLKYTESHEWIRLDGSKAFVGITDYAQESLGDIVYIELPATGSSVAADEELTTIESVKAAEPIYSPLPGIITEVNEELNDKPELLNSQPYEAYIFVLELEDPAVKVVEFTFSGGLVQAQHGQAVSDAAERIQGFSAHTLGGRFGCDDLGILPFQFQKLVKEPVIGRVGDLRVVHDVVEVVVTVDLLPQHPHPFKHGTVRAILRFIHGTSLKWKQLKWKYG